MNETMDNQQAKTFLDRGWLIGFIEGEGSFSLVRTQQNMPGKGHHKYFGLRPQFIVCSTDFEFIERASQIMCDNGLPVYKMYRKYTAKRDQMAICIVGLKRCLRLLEIFIPLMTESRKKEVAKTLLEYCEHRLSLPHKTPYGNKEYELWKKMRELNGYDLRKSLRDSTRGVFDYKQGMFDYNTKVESTPI